MTTPFYGSTYVLTHRPDEARLAEIAAEIAAEHLPEIEKWEYRLSDTPPEMLPELETSELLRVQAGNPGSTFLLVYPAVTTGRHTPTHGPLPR
jgi:hypothetical protein